MDTHASQWQKMLAGEIYDAPDPYLLELLMATRRKLWHFNNTDPGETEALDRQLRDILGACGPHLQVNQPFRCDFGCNISVGDHFFANFNLTVLDEAPVTIGSYAFIGPNVSIYTACHPLDATTRNTMAEWARPVTIGDNVWIGGSATILPGVTIGDNVVIGAGSVVSRDIPSDCVAAGNPASVIRKL